MRLFVFGLGYTAQVISLRLLSEGWQIAGTCRSQEKKAALEAAGIRAFLFDADRPLENTASALDGATHVLHSVPPGEAGDAVLMHHGQDIAALEGLQWFGYLSTTGVYGDHQGGWVDESTPRTPAGPRGQRRADAELGWMAHYEQSGLPVHLFRLPGIYGPGRSALDSVRAGRTRRLFKDGQVFSRIHVEDLASGVIASMKRPNPGSAYNLCDDEPAPPQDVTAFACDLLGLPVEPLTPIEEADLSPMARSFYGESKRVRNDKMKTELGVTLAYPTYRDGLRALLAKNGH
ncbi:MAG: SDR family oxidoreductase [Alphaproteobacteria bacterium]